MASKYVFEWRKRVLLEVVNLQPPTFNVITFGKNDDSHVVVVLIALFLAMSRRLVASEFSDDDNFSGVMIATLLPILVSR